MDGDPAGFWCDGEREGLKGGGKWEVGGLKG